MPDLPRNPCATCGVCCRSYVVPLNGYDVWAISTGQRLPPEQYVVALAQENPGRDGFLLEAGGPLYGLALDKQGPLKPDRPCIFLMHLGGGNDRCGIYEQRPQVCRAYPMSMIRNQVTLRNDALCPPDVWTLDEKNRQSWKFRLNELDRHFDVYHEVVSRWNARVIRNKETVRFSLSEYLSYVLNVYERLNRLEAEIDESDRQVIASEWRTPLPGNESEVRPVWIQYFTLVRRTIDTFFPELPPLPLRLITRPFEEQHDAVTAVTP